jgi:hypothetical protein
VSADQTGHGEPEGSAADRADTGQERHFAAFISYAHSDSAIASRLHSAIETYRLPKGLRAANGAAALSGRLGSVFRDRADLAAADSLSEAIRDALSRSRALIVLCSPAAQSSRWVDAEIRLFRELHPAAPVLAAIVSGDPAAVMPWALTEGGREPLAADLREVGDGWKLGFLKIAAALAQVPLDALIQRDAQRRLRRVMAVTVAAGLALIGTVAMTSFAIQQRNEAQAQREEAERRRAQADGLVEFMLTELRTGLRGVGRLDIMRSAVASALESYDEGTERGALPPASLGQLARLLHALGEDDYGANRPEEAARSFRQAAAITAPLLADAPRDPDRIYNHAQSEYWLGAIAIAADDIPTVERHWREYLALARRLRQVEPGSRRALQEIAYAEGNLCTAAQMAGGDGVDLCRRSFDAQAALAERYPDDIAILTVLGNRAGWYADALERRDGEGAGLAIRQRQLAIARQLLARDPGNYEFRDRLVSGLYSVGTALVRAGRPVDGQARLAEARPIISAMRRHDPANRRWRSLEQLVAEQLAVQAERAQ